MKKTLGRILLAAVFLSAGAYKALHTEETNVIVNTALRELGLRRYFDVDGISPLCCIVATALEITGGLALLFGGYTCGSWFLVPFILLVSPIIHFPFKRGNFQFDSCVQLMKDFALLGALLIIWHDNPHGPAKAKKKVQ